MKIVFKAKVDNKGVIKLKKTIKRNDCRNFENSPLWNSVIFETHVNRIYQNLLKRAEFVKLSELPSFVKVLDTGFLKTVEITVD